MRKHEQSEFVAYVGPNNRQYDYTVRVHDGSSWTDLTRLYGRDFVKNVSIDETLDTPSRQCDVTVQRRFDLVEMSPPPNKDYLVDRGALSLDNPLEVWTQISVTGTQHPPICVFQGRIASVDPGKDEIKIICRDVCHDLTQLYIAPGLTGPATSPTQAPQPGGDEEYEGTAG